MSFHTKVESSKDGADVSYTVTCVSAATGGECFTSSGWTTKKAANSRAREHHTEHKGDGVSRELEAFRSGVSQDEYDQRIAEQAKSAQGRDILEEA